MHSIIFIGYMLACVGRIAMKFFQLVLNCHLVSIIYPFAFVACMLRTVVGVSLSFTFTVLKMKSPDPPLLFYIKKGPYLTYVCYISKIGF